MMNPASLMKIMNARNKFVENHPKFAAFLNAVFSAGITEGTVIEITVTKPGEEPITTNMKVLSPIWIYWTSLRIWRSNPARAHCI